MPEDGLKIRLARLRDVPDIVRVLRAAYEQYRGKVEPPLHALSTRADEVAWDIRAGRRGYFVAQLGDRIVGTLRFREMRVRGRRVLALSRLAVLPDARGMGIGNHLMQEAERLARKLGIRELRGNVRVALSFLVEYYGNLGYKVIGRRSKPGYPRYLYVIAKWLPKEASPRRDVLTKEAGRA